MADKEVFEIDVQGVGDVDKAIKTVKDLKNALKEAKDAQVAAAQQYGNDSKEYVKASQRVSELRDSVDDLSDSTRSLQGSGIERASAGFNQLGEGLRNLDFDKVKVGLTAMKTALAAVGIGLIVQLVSYLIENFKELSSGSGLLAKILQGVGDVISFCSDKIAEFTDWLGITNTALDKQGEAIKENADKAKEAINEQTAAFDRQIAVSKAAGKSTIELEIAKQEAIVQTNKAIADQIVAFVKAGGELNDEQKKIFSEAVNNIKNAKTQEKVIELTAQKEITDNLKKENEKRAAEHKAYLDTLRQQWLDYQLNRDSDQAAYEAKNKAFADQVRAEEQAYIDNKRAQEQIDRDNADLALHEKAEKEKAAADASTQLERDKANATLQIAQISLQSQSQLVDAFYEFKRQGLQKGSKEDLKAAENQFKIQKALAIQTAIISGIQGVVNALSAQSVVPEPFGTVLKVATAVGVGIAAAVNVAKIAATKFNPGTTSGGGGGGAPSVPIPSPPTISTQANNINKGTTFDESGKNTGASERAANPTINVNVKAEVVESEMTEKQDRAAQLKNQSTF